MSLLVLGLTTARRRWRCAKRLSVEREQLPDALKQLAAYVPQSVILPPATARRFTPTTGDDIGLVGRVGNFLIAIRESKDRRWSGICIRLGKASVCSTCSG